MAELTAKLGIDTSGAIDELTALAVAIERVNDAVEELKGKGFSKIEVAVVGAVAKVTVYSETE